MNQIFFKYTTGPYGWLSNFSLHPVTFQGKVYLTSEHLYQSLKFVDPKTQETIRAAANPKMAAHLGRTLLGMRKDWDEEKIAIMEEVLWQKLDSNRELEAKLLSTGEAELIEESRKDSFWGNGADGKGRNELGKLWMKIREELRLREEKNERRINWN